MVWDSRSAKIQPGPIQHTHKRQIPRAGADVERDGLGGDDPFLLTDIPSGDILSSDTKTRPNKC